MKFSTYLGRLIAKMKREQKISKNDPHPNFFICNQIVELNNRAPLSQIDSYKEHGAQLDEIIRSKIQRNEDIAAGHIFDTLSYILPPEPGKDRAEWKSRINWLTALKEIHKQKGN